MKNVLVAFDGSDSAMRAVRQIVTMSDLGRPHVHLLHVRDPLLVKDAVLVKDSPRAFDDIQRAHLDAGMELLRPAREILDDAHIDNEPHVVIGETAQTIVQTAARLGCDLIAMGTRGLGPLSGIMLGSVANKVVHAAELPVLLVK